MERKQRYKGRILVFAVFMVLFLGACQSSEKDISITETVESKPSNEIEAPKEVTIDGITYTDYKGPVQGEIKYQEGRPAEENAKVRKASGDIGSPFQIRLLVTNGFGNQDMFDKSVGLVKDEVGMEVLFRNLDIATAYGGGFVNEINGLDSKFTFYTGEERRKEDWFYWVNGILAPIGIAEYRPQPGDVVWWDHHDWSVSMFIPAVIGSYPQPFKNGFGGKIPPTTILYTEKFEEEAHDLEASLKEFEVAEVDCMAYTPELLEDSDRYLILIGPWEKLSEKSEHLKTINKKNKLVGVYGKFDKSGLNALDFKGRAVESFSEKAGLIYAHSPGINGMHPFWCVTGIDEEGVRLAVKTMVNSPEKLYKCFSVVITPEQVISCPFEE